LKEAKLGLNLNKTIRKAFFIFGDWEKKKNFFVKFTSCNIFDLLKYRRETSFVFNIEKERAKITFLYKATNANRLLIVNKRKSHSGLKIV
jgi:hypothetical protein